MVRAIIRFSAQNRALVLLATACVVAYGLYTIQHIPVDAIPDLSDTQVIVYSRWDRSPDIVEDQVTYPIVSALLGTPKVKTIRGFSDFGFSYVYVIFEDGTDIYWARSRVLEYLSKIQPLLPAGVSTELGPDATGVGWVYQYALVDDSGTQSLADLRTLQDWNLRYRVQSVPGVAEVASIGGFVQQYQVTVDPNRLRAFDLGIMDRRRRGEVEQQRGGRAAAGIRRPRVHGARPRLREVEGRSRAGGAQDRPARHAGAAAGRRVGGARARDAPRHRGPRRARRGGRRDRRHAPRRERARGHPPREGAAEGAGAVAAAGREDRADLRPLGSHRSVHRHAAPRADARDHHCQRGDPDLPVAHPLSARAHHHDPGRGAAGVHPDAADGHFLEHHVAGGHRDLDRRPRRRRDRGGRERLQEAGVVGARRPERRLPRHPARGAAGSRAVGLLLPARHRRRLPPDLHAGGPGRPALHAARVDEEPDDVHRGAARADARPRAAHALHAHGLPRLAPAPAVVAGRPGDGRAVLS